MKRKENDSRNLETIVFFFFQKLKIKLTLAFRITLNIQNYSKIKQVYCFLKSFFYNNIIF